MKARIRDTEIFFDVDGAGLVADGPVMRERPTALVINGGPGADHVITKDFYSSFKDRMQLVFFDHRGTGRSARGDSSKYTLDENVEDMEALRRHLGLGPIVSFGASYGGMVALAHAARYPESVSHLLAVVTVSHSGYAERARQIARERGTPEQVQQCEEFFAGRVDTQEKIKHFLHVMGTLYSRKYDPASVGLANPRYSFDPIAQNRGHAPGGFLRTFDLRPELKNITAPTLIVGGRYDWICAPEFSEEIHRLIPGSVLRIFENSGHAVSLDEPEAFKDLVSGFLIYNNRAGRR